VGWTSLPLTFNSAHSAGNTRSGRLTRRSGSRTGRAGIAVFAHIGLSWFKRRRPWFISWSNNALATVPFPSRMVDHFLKPQFRAQHARLGFLTASDQVERPLSLALVDEPMVQLQGCAPHFKKLASAYRPGLRAQARRVRKGKGPPCSWLISASQSRRRPPPWERPARSKRGRRSRIVARSWGTRQRRRHPLRKSGGSRQGKRRCWRRSPIAQDCC